MRVMTSMAQFISIIRVIDVKMLGALVETIEKGRRLCPGQKSMNLEVRADL